MAKNTGKIVTGALAGLALGVAAGLFLNSKKGKKLQKDVQHTAADFYKYISPRLKKIQKMGKEEYHEFMEKAVEQYKKAKKLSGPLAEELKKEVRDSWGHLSKHFGK